MARICYTFKRDQKFFLFLFTTQNDTLILRALMYEYAYVHRLQDA